MQLSTVQHIINTLINQQKTSNLDDVYVRTQAGKTHKIQSYSIDKDGDLILKWMNASRDSIIVEDLIEMNPSTNFVFIEGLFEGEVDYYLIDDIRIDNGMLVVEHV